MNEKDLEQEIQKNVLERIKSGKTHMHTRAYFLVRIIATVVVTLIALVLSAFVLSFIVFSIHESGEQCLLGFGGRGVVTFFILFPWIPLIIDIAILFLLEWLVQGFKFAYRISLLSIFLAVVAVSTLLAVLVGLTPAHRDLLDSADRGDLPVVGQLYENIRAPHEDQGIFRGTVVSTQGNQIVITHDDGDQDVDDGTRTVVLPPNAPSFSIGDSVYVYGAGNGDQIQAYGIEKLAPSQ